MNSLGLILLVFIGILVQGKAQEAPLGFPIKLTDIYIPGEKMEPIPRSDLSSSLVVRVLQTRSASEGFRYDLEVYGLDPGKHQLKDYLHYIHDKSPITDLKTEITITTIHPLDSLPPPTEIHPTPPKPLGGYRTLMIVAGIIWVIVFLGILFYRKKKTVVEETLETKKTLQERLSPLVEASAKGKLSAEERSHLERLILGHWKQKLPDLDLSQLREHPDSSPLILKLEQWLHTPNPTTSQEEISELLTPYRED